MPPRGHFAEPRPGKSLPRQGVYKGEPVDGWAPVLDGPVTKAIAPGWMNTAARRKRTAFQIVVFLNCCAWRCSGQDGLDIPVAMPCKRALRRLAV
jgi:hypothetical protein